MSRKAGPSNCQAYNSSIVVWASASVPRAMRRSRSRRSSADRRVGRPRTGRRRWPARRVRCPDRNCPACHPRTAPESGRCGPLRRSRGAIGRRPAGLGSPRWLVRRPATVKVARPSTSLSEYPVCCCLPTIHPSPSALEVDLDQQIAGVDGRVLQVVAFEGERLDLRILAVAGPSGQSGREGLGQRAC
jgi:hypothetical protein